MLRKALKINPRARLLGMDNFYVSGLATSATVIVETPTESDMSSADTRGTWFVQQFIGAARRLWVESYVVPFSDPKYLTVPVMEDISEYEAAWHSVREGAVRELEVEFPRRKRQIERLALALEEAEYQLSELENLEITPLPPPTAGEDPDVRKQKESDYRNEVRAAADNIKLATKEATVAYNTWSVPATEFRKDSQKIAEWYEEARDEAEKQLAADKEAITRMTNAIAILKKFVVALFEHVPEAEVVARKIGDSGMDPLAVDDLRGVYCNLLNRYMNSNELGVATTILARMADTQKGRSLPAFMRGIDEFYQLMIRLGVYSITIGDLSAIIALSNMDDAPREQFLESETALALTRENMGDDDFADESDSGTMCTTKRAARPMLVKIKAFVDKVAEKELRSSQLRNSGTLASGGGAPKTDAAAASLNKSQALRLKKKEMREAAQIYATTVCNMNPKSCFEYVRTGECAKGSLCKYSHDVTVAIKSQQQPKGGPNNQPHQQGESAGSAGAGGGGGNQGTRGGAAGSTSNNSMKDILCKQWVKRGECSYGSHCKYLHPALKQSAATSKTATTASGAAASMMFALGTGSWLGEESEEEEEIRVVLDSSTDSDLCMSAVLAQHENHMIGWDSMASVNVAGTMSVIPGAKALPKRRAAYGVGGCKSITHSGPSPIFGMDMVYIDGGGTPNLMSLGRALQKDKTGKEGIAIFSANGAVRFRANAKVQAKLARLISELEAEGLIEGTAVMKNHVYQEHFGHRAAAASCWPSAGEVLESVQEEESAYAITLNMFANRVHLDRVDDCIDFLGISGVGKATLDGPLLGVPKIITEEKVDHFYKHIGKDVAMQEAEITAAPLRHPLDYVPEPPAGPGATLLIDNVDPPFSRLKQPESDSEEISGSGAKVKSTKKVVLSIGGFKDCVLAVDGATGFIALEGRVSKKDPHKVMELFLKQWIGRWKCLKEVRLDKEFVTPESLAIIKAAGVKLRQAVPGDHRHGNSMVEGVIRWIQDAAQGFMNRAKAHVRSKLITEEQHRSLWFHALLQAVMAWNLRPSLCNKEKTRYEEGTGVVANLSTIVMMPFGMHIVAKKLKNDADGRGSQCLYIGPSRTVPGGIMTYNLETHRPAVKYAFAPVIPAVRATPARLKAAQKVLFGDMVAVSEPAATARVVPCTSELVSSSVIPVAASTDVVVVSAEKAAVGSQASVELSTLSDVLTVSATDVSGGVTGGVVQSNVVQPTFVSSGVTAELPAKPPDAVTPRGGVQLSTAVSEPVAVVRRVPKVVVSDYSTRSRGGVLGGVAYAAMDRPLKPMLPSRKVMGTERAWERSRVREATKLMSMDTLLKLPVDPVTGRSIRPPGAIVLRLLVIYEYKWKVDPDTGVERWLECARFVCDGSVDTRKETSYYAETPDRTLLFLMVSIGASIGEKVSGSDVERAYLNALSLDRNIVILAAPNMGGIPRESLLNKGLYGSRGGALSWQVWIDARMEELGYSKLDVARGVYVKRLESGELVRAYRHSDDFRISSLDAAGKFSEEARMRAAVKMAAFSKVDRFLGCTFEYIDQATGAPSEDGRIVLVRQREKIAEMVEKFAHLHQRFNPKNRARKAACPLDAIQNSDECEEKVGKMLTTEEQHEYMSIVGSLGWIVGSTRPDAKFAYFLLARRCSKPREWDMYLAVWVMDYLAGTSDAPLVLGGSIVNPEVMADASHATLAERRSICGHFLSTGPKSGAIFAQVHYTKCAVDSIFEAELIAGCRGCDTAVYATNLCDELEYKVSRCRRVRVDNEAEIEWIKGDVSNKRSKHIDTKMYRARHLQENGDVSVEYVSTEDNTADVLTKAMVVGQFRVMAARILGHELIRHLVGIVPGIICEE